ncbi:MAG: phosphosugar isomerase [Actinomycetia bacterium]|jgi:D-arabinose 5-phosphate isomerase GutQ|nr:phosphosugar isomerase [Actinomycetes bacterium]
MAPSRTIDEALLDDPDALAAADRGETLRALAGAGAQVRAARTLAAEAGAPRVAEDGRPRAVVVSALGGSAVVADLLTALAGPGSPVPVMAVHSGTLPGWVSPLDLVVSVSVSGRAVGPLAATAEAARRGCRLLTVGRAGSPLADVCTRARGVHVPTPPEVRSSRVGLWAMAVPLLMAADALGLVDAGAEVLDAVADRLDQVAEAARPASESFVNPAKSLAVDLAGSLPLVLGAGDLAGVAALRAAAQLARNARHPAVPGILPDAAAEVVATFDGPFARATEDLFADPFEPGQQTALRLLLLRDSVDEEDPAVARVAEAVRDAATDGGVRVGQLRAEPGPPLARVASLVGLTDFASVYVALGLGLDPATSPHVADLKERMSP